MKRPWIAGWELTTNEKGVEMATLPAQMLRDTLAYLENLEKQCNIANVVEQSKQCCDKCGSEYYHTYKCTNTLCENCIIHD